MKKLLLILGLLLPVALFGQTNVDSLFLQFEECSGSKRAQVADNLIAIFEKEGVYDYPVPKERRAKFDEMLVFLGKGLHDLHAGRFTKAVDLGLLAEKLVPKDSLRWLSSCYELLDVSYFRQGKFDRALEYAHKDYAVGMHLKDDKLCSSALNTMASIHCYTRHLDKALEYINRAVELERAGEDDKTLAIRLGVRSEILLLMDQSDEALASIDEAIDLDSKANRIEKVGIRISQKATIFAHRQQWEECRSACLQALEIFDQTGNVMEQILTLKQLGACEIHLKKYDSAEKHLKRAETLCITAGTHPQLYRIQQHLGTLYEKTHQLDQALDYLKRSMVLSDSLNQERQQNIIAEYQMRFDVQEKERQLEIQQETIQKREIMAVSGLVLALLATIVAISGYNLAKIRKKRNAELAAVNEMKDHFLSLLSHDLKNPVIAQGQLLTHLLAHYDEINDEVKKQHLRALKESGGQLSELLTNLLDWASIETGRYVCNPIRVDLSAVVCKNVQLIQIAAKEKNIRIQSEVPEGCQVFTDHNFLTTILRNLLNNAVKFSYEGGTVEISAVRSMEYTSISIIDHGMGMTEAQKASVFQSKVILTEGTRSETGTGLGLIVSKTLAQEAHGNLSFQSKEGEGSTFTLTLPTTEEVYKKRLL